MQHWNDGWHMGWMGIWWVLVAVAFITALWITVRSARNGPASGESPEQVLKRRYASGEIDRETYRRMLDDLRQ